MSLNKLRFNFNLEVLNGCRWSCVGCYVNKKEENSFSIADIKNFQKLSESLKGSEYIPSILILGPTDIFTANNSLEILTESEFYKLTKSFERLTFTSTFLALSDDVVEVLKIFSHVDLEFKLIIDLPKFNDDDLKKLANNIKLLKKLIGRNIVIHPQLNLFNAASEKLKEALTNYKSINERSYFYFNQGVDYAVSFGRSKVSKNYQLKAYELLKATFNREIETQMHFDAGKLDDISENIFTFKNGEFFYAPKIYDEYVNFYEHNRLNIIDWSANEFQDFLKANLIDQYTQMDTLPCKNCDYNATCADRGAIKFLNHLGTNQCIFPTDAYNKINIGKLGLA